MSEFCYRTIPKDKNLDYFQLINVITSEVTNVSLMFRKVQGGSFHFAPYRKMKNQAFKSRTMNWDFVWETSEVQVFGIVQKTKTATLVVSLEQLTSAMD